MRPLVQRFRSVAVALVALGVLLLAFKFFRQWRENFVESELLALKFDTLEINNADFESALRQVTDKVHRLGHPEVDLTFYPNPNRAPNFVPRTMSTFGERGREPFNLKISADGDRPYQESVQQMTDRANSGGMPVTLKEILGEIRFHFGYACSLRDRHIVATPGAGTLGRWHRNSVRLSDDLFSENFRGKSDEAVKNWLVENGVDFYSGMTVHPRKDRPSIEVYAPDDQIEFIYTILDLHPATTWQTWEMIQNQCRMTIQYFFWRVTNP